MIFMIHIYQHLVDFCDGCLFASKLDFVQFLGEDSRKKSSKIVQSRAKCVRDFLVSKLLRSALWLAPTLLEH